MKYARIGSRGIRKEEGQLHAMDSKPNETNRKAGLSLS